MRLHLEGDEQVARSPAPGAALALPAQPHPGARVHAPRHGHLDLAVLAHRSRPLARFTRIGGNPAPPQARRAGSLHGESALAEGDGARSRALLAAGGGRSRLGAVAPTGGALLGHGHRDGDAPPRHRHLEADVHHVLDVVALARARGGFPGGLPASAIEYGTEDVAEPAQIVEGKPLPGPRRPGARGGRPSPVAPEAEGAQAPHLVVLLALGGVGEHRVGLAHLLEPLGRRSVALVGVRMVSLRQPAIRLLDLLGRRLLRDAEGLVVVFRRRRHRPRPP